LTSKFIIAYEPVWAIGTGQVATIEQVAEIHEHLFKFMTTSGFQNLSILYGGSVKPDNAKELIQVPYVDGFLIGGASLQVDSFLKICSVG
jgi:triosephosphate isomerase (TIM)